MTEITTAEHQMSQGEILVVDDTSANLKLLVDLLVVNNYKVRPAGDGKQALKAVEKRKPDLILLDIMMPDIDGYEVCRRLKENANTRDIPIIFISALDALEDRIKGFDMGGADYITKPIQPKEVLARVHNHMQLHHLQVHLEELVDQRTLELQKSTEKLRQSYHRLEWAEKIGHLGHWEWNILTNDCHLSDEVFRILGIEPQSLNMTHDDYMAFIDPEDRHQVAQGLSHSLSDEQQLYSSEHRIIQHNGAIRYVFEQGRVNYDESGNATSLVATILDITERKLAQKKEHQDAMRMHTMMLQTITAIGTTVEKRDPYTAGHQQRVADLSVAIAQEMKLDSIIIEGVRLGALIHDIGKIYLPAEILSRPGTLTDIEFEMIKTHSKVGFDIVKNVDFPWPVANMILQHHERLDGTGYPQGLKAVDIILQAKILAVADVVEAMASHRPYRVSPGLDVALEEVQKGSGIRYDSEVVRCCILLFREKGYSLPALDRW